MNRVGNKRPVNINWTLCFICQKKHLKDLAVTDETLKTVANNITEYRNVCELDLEWNDITEISDETGNRTNTSTLYESLKKNKAIFHRACGTKYNRQKRDRILKKRNEDVQSANSSLIATRSSIEKNECIILLCNM